MENKVLQQELKSIGIDIPEPGEVVRLSGNAVSADIVVETKDYKKWINLLWGIPIFIVAILLLSLLILLSQNKIVPGDIVGSSYSKFGVSIVPDTYSVSQSDLVTGSTVYVGDNSSFPIFVNYKKYIVKRVSGLQIFVKDPTSKIKDLKQITIYDVAYVVQN